MFATQEFAELILNDSVNHNFFQEHYMSVLRILTGRGTEYCGKAKHHDYELYLVINDIEHTKPKRIHRR